jgi:hypothetical protein
VSERLHDLSLQSTDLERQLTEARAVLQRAQSDVARMQAAVQVRATGVFWWLLGQNLTRFAGAAVADGASRSGNPHATGGAGSGLCDGLLCVMWMSLRWLTAFLS